MKQVCGNCRYYITPQCWEKKHNRRHPGPCDWCAGWRDITPAAHERQEEARMEAAEIRKEMREAKG